MSLHPLSPGVSPFSPVGIPSEEIANVSNDGQSNDGATGQEAKSEYQGSATFGSGHSIVRSSMFTATSEGRKLSQTSMNTMDTIATQTRWSIECWSSNYC